MTLTQVASWMFVNRRPVKIAPHWDRESALLMASAALAQREWRLIESALHDGGETAMKDARCVNMLGLAAELRGDWKRAHKMYGRAMWLDRSFLPAERNMRRYYEMFTFGRSNVPISWACVGDKQS